MTRSVSRRPRATRDLDETASFIAQDSPDAAFRFLEAAERAFGQLAGTPGLGGVWETDDPRLAGLRVWPIPGFEKYLVFYRPADDGIEVIRVLHGSRDIDSLLRR
jgi:toxin ParE1/3/4